jgi:poly-gamma-glutamate capsule biosynthesis protein CapA/YwtB (metallophosphatase superfamily)
VLGGILLLGAAGIGGYLLGDQLGLLGDGSWAAPVSPQAGPTATPSPSPSLSPSPAPPPRGRLLIHGTGDVNLDPSYIPNLAANGYDYAWSGLGGLFRDDDLTVVNLECPASDQGNPLDKQFVFRCDTAALDEMRRAGVEVANQGNNHAYDQGPEALVDSLRQLRGAGVLPVGAGRDERRSLRPARLERGGWRIAVLGFGMVLDPEYIVAGPDSPGVAGGHDPDLMIRTIRRVARHADLVVVTIHWGVELDPEPRAEQVTLGRAFVDAGADVIFGHHAHRLQPVDRYRGRPIFWGLGNFVWPNFSAEGSTTAVARVVVRPNGRIEGRLLPALIEAPGHPVLPGSAS